MLLARAHAFYWILSFGYLHMQPLRGFLGELLSIDNDSQALFDYAIGLYALWFCLCLIELRTRVPLRPPNWQNQRPGNQKIWERVFVAVFEVVVEGRRWAYGLGRALMCLVVGDWALWASGVGEEEDVVRGKIVRVLATFMFLGMTEPIWHDVGTPAVLNMCERMLMQAWRNSGRILKSASWGVCRGRSHMRGFGTCWIP